jgi:ferrochelatase
MAYGGPASLDELPGYLADIRSGRVTTPAVLEEMLDHYRKIGGRSPLLEITRRQVDAIASYLDPHMFRCYLGMRHWSPWIDDVVAAMAKDGITRAVSLVMAPHYSSMSIERYRARIRDGLAAHHVEIEFAHIDEYHDADGLIKALARRVALGLAAWPERERDEVHVVFSAHSLPARILKEGDTYDAQLRATATLVAAAAQLRDEQWSWSYQSAGKSPEPWLGPQLEAHVSDLIARGKKKIVSIPVGFLADHVELLYDIDIEAREVAERSGARLVRPPAINDDPEVMAELARLVRGAAARWTGEAVR